MCKHRAAAERRPTSVLALGTAARSLRAAASSNVVRACCRAALKSDPFCFEAYSALVDNHMLSNDQELELLKGLDFTADNQWLAMLYLTMGKKACDLSANVETCKVCIGHMRV